MWRRTRSTGRSAALNEIGLPSNVATSARIARRSASVMRYGCLMRRYRRNPQTAGRVIDGQAFIVTPDDNKLHTLNGAATQLWVLSAANAITSADAADALV